MSNRTLAIILSLVALSSFGCDRKKDRYQTHWEVNTVYGSVECGDGQHSLILGNVDNGPSTSADNDGYLAQYDVNTGVVSFTHLDLGANETPVRSTRSTSGDVFVAGNTRDDSKQAIFLAKFDKELELQWKITRIGTAEFGVNSAADLELDSNGNIWVCGSLEQSGGSRHIWVAAYDTNGSLLAENLVRKDASLAKDTAYRIQRSEENIFYVLGAQYEIPQFYLVSQPALLQPTLAVSPSVLTVNPQITAPASSGNYSIASPAYSLSIPSVKLLPMDIWLGRFVLDQGELNAVFEATKDGTSPSSYDRPVAMDVDAAGEVVVGGILVNEDAGLDIWVAKFGSTEEPLWEGLYDSTDGQSPVSDVLTDLQMDSNGDLFFCGSYAGDIIVGKLDGQSGSTLWKDVQAGTDPQYTDRAVDLDVDGEGNLYVTGNLRQVLSSNSEKYEMQIWSCKYAPDGTRIYEAYKGSSLASFGMEFGASARKVAHDSEGRLLALGVVVKVNNLKAYLYDGLFRQDIWVAGYSSENPSWERTFSGTRTTAGIESSSTEVTSQSNAVGFFTDSQDGVHIYGDHDSQVTGRDGMYYVLNSEGSDSLPEPVRMNGLRDAEDRSVFGTWMK